LTRHFLTGDEISAAEVQGLIDRAQQLKAVPYSSDALARRAVALIFQKPSTRTRVSFEAGIAELGGTSMVLRTDDLQLTRGESVRDTAYVISRHAAAVGIRTGADRFVQEFAEHAQVPVFNMLTEGHHPCQALADLLTLQEAFGRLAGLKVAYVGDGNNVARSLALLGIKAGVEVRIASPPQYALTDPPSGAVLTDDPRAAAQGSDAIYTDVWLSMGDDPQSAERKRAALGPYQLDAGLLELAAPQAIVLHCLPAHPGEEITEELLYGSRQRIWEQAENRRHAQKALLELLVSG
jgi:ornithine carbamoyltransferase